MRSKGRQGVGNTSSSSLQPSRKGRHSSEASGAVHLQLILYLTMGSSTPTIRLFAAVFAIIFLAAPAASITCSDVIKDIRPCLNYLKSGSGAPPAPCCSGASNLASSATTTADKQTACNCLKNASKNTNLKPELAKALPKNCGISLPFEVSTTVDCSK
ncbi:hypothetical protein BUALT_Bualt19G0033100 [Buddleja alternifolia]|uniref:Non-specific lipid-transfer protein n=1 Tax=Buddleja alternifolia TaxID=168488 RepID=A0AAV6W6S3_9LAMI|nr:hypothetical protein BUALT_Bualt19G0033100 [Buddleja alternifolia]